MRDGGFSPITSVLSDDFSPDSNGATPPSPIYVLVTEDGLNYIGLENDAGILALE